MRLHPTQPDRLYQQNHCGIYRIDRPDGPLGAHRDNMPHRRRRHRVPDRTAPPRPRHRLGVPDGRHRRVAPHQPRRSPRRVRHPRRRRERGPPGPGAPRPWLVHGEAPGHDRRRAATPSGCTSAPPAARCGRAPTRASSWRCIAAHLPEIYSVEVTGRQVPGEGPDPDAPALVHRPAADVDRRRGDGRGAARRPRPAVPGHPVPRRRRAGPPPPTT